MPSHKLGKLLYPVIVLLCLSACRNSVPPKIEICIGDGFGGADCIEADGSKKYRPPTELLNYWMTSEPDEANFATWCYDAPSEVVKSQMNETKSKLK